MHVADVEARQINKNNGFVMEHLETSQYQNKYLLKSTTSHRLICPILIKIKLL